MKNIGIAVVDGAAIPWIAGISRIARISRVSNLSEIAKTFIYNHIFMEFANVCACKLVDMGSIDLAHGLPTELVDIFASDITYSTA